MKLIFNLLIIIFITNQTLSADWERWRGPNGNGLWNGPQISQKLPKAGLKRIWRTKINPGYSGVTVSNGRVYLMDKETGEERKAYERVLCLNAHTGDIIWKFLYPVNYKDMGYGKGPRASVLIHKDKAFGFGARGHAFSLDARNGEKIWFRNLSVEEKAILPIWGFSSTPEIIDGEIIYHAGCQPLGSIISLSADSGSTLWKAGKDDKAGYAPPLLIESREKKQLVCWGPNKIMGICKEDKSIVWEIPYEVKYGVSITKPIFHQSIILVTGYWHGTRAIQLSEDLQKAKILWSDEDNIRGLMSQALYRKGTCYMLDRSNGLTSFELRTGKIFWRDNHNLTAADRNPQASLVWVDQSKGEALALNAEGELVFLNLNKDGYKEYWREQVVAKTWAHPAYSGKYVYARDDESVVCYELPLD